MAVQAAVGLGTAALGYQVYSGQKQQKQQRKCFKSFQKEKNDFFDKKKKFVVF